MKKFSQSPNHSKIEVEPSSCHTLEIDNSIKYSHSTNAVRESIKQRMQIVGKYGELSVNSFKNQGISNASMPKTLVGNYSSSKAYIHL